MSAALTTSAPMVVENEMSLDGLTCEEDEITLLSKDGQPVRVKRRQALISEVVRVSLEQDSKATEVPLPSVDYQTLLLIQTFMEHHDGKDCDIVEKPLRSKKMKDVCKDPWDADFVNVIALDRQKLYDLILACNYMDIKGCMHLGCAKVASLIKGQPMEEIKKILDPDTSIKRTLEEDEGPTQTVTASSLMGTSSATTSGTTSATTTSGTLSATTSGTSAVTAPVDDDDEEEEDDE